MRTLLLLWLAAPLLCGAYGNLIATSDGKAVYFEAKTGPVATSWYVARESGVTAVDGALADVGGAGTVFASATLYERHCGFAGSSCWLAAPCSATFRVQGPGFDYGSSTLRTLARLSRSGEFLWLTQSACVGIGPRPAEPPASGLYVAATRALAARHTQGVLANPRMGRRAITDRGRALVMDGGQLAWLDAQGYHLIRNVAGAAEAATDALGENVVYVEYGSGRLHWVTGPDWLGARDTDLGVVGSAPALTDDGAAVLYLDRGGALQFLPRDGGAPRRLGAETVASFATGGGAVFAAAHDGWLLRFDLADGRSAVWAPPFPEIDVIDAPRRIQPDCTWICYAPTELPKLASPGMVVVLRGRSLGESGWRVRAADSETPLHPISEIAAWFQVPNGFQGAATFSVFRPDFPVRYQFKVEAVKSAAVCLGALHQDFSSTVSDQDPSRPGEVVHLYLTGMGAEAVPPLADAGAFETLYFGPAPGFAGLQQFDARVLRPTSALFSGVPEWNCAPLPVAAR